MIKPMDAQCPNDEGTCLSPHSALQNGPNRVRASQHLHNSEEFISGDIVLRVTWSNNSANVPFLKKES